MRECLSKTEQPLKKLTSKSPGRTHWAMRQWRFFIASMHHVAVQRQSICFAPKRSSALDRCWQDKVSIGVCNFLARLQKKLHKGTFLVL